jgi:hypothetical protein
MITILLFVSFISHGYTLQCHWGTTASISNCTTTDACITGALLNGTTVYSCGDCAFFQTNLTNYVGNVTCCSTTDYCNTITSPPPLNGSCEAVIDSHSCLNRTDCYWCNNSVFDSLGLCQPRPPLPCWGVPVLVAQPLVCGTVECAPFEPAYTVDVLTLAYLTAFEFPSVVTASGDVGARGLGLDILSREVRYLNDTYQYCLVNEEVKQWCGVNTYTDFEYCIVSEKWPQDDVWGWMQNTTFAAPTLTPVFPAICACPIAGRAYYIPGRSVDQTQHFGPACGIENTELAFYIGLALMFVIVLLLVLWDTGVTLIRFIGKIRKGKAKANNEIRNTISTLVVKFFVIVYLVLSIITLMEFISPGGSNPILNTNKAVMCFLTVIALLGGFHLASFRYTEILLVSELFGSQDAWSARALRIFKWIFLATVLLPLFAALGMVGGFAYYVQIAIEYAVSNLTGLAFAGNKTAVLAQALMCILLIVQAWELLVIAVLQFVVNHRLLSVSSKLKGMHNLMGRDVALLVALLMGIPNWALLIVLTIIVGWQQTGVDLSWWASSYEAYIAYLWLIWAYFFTGLLWSAAYAYAMRTNVGNDVLVNRFIDLFGLGYVIKTPKNASKSGSTASMELSMMSTVNETTTDV